MINFYSTEIFQFRNSKYIYCIMKLPISQSRKTRQLPQILPSKKLAFSSEKYAFPLGNGNFLQ